MNSNTDAARRSVIIIGGGYTGACIAIQLLRQARHALDISIIERAERLGPGLAYAATDPDHRLNAQTYAHTLLPDDAWHFARWCVDQDLLTSDPQCLWPDGGMYMRRSDFGRYIEDTLGRYQRSAPQGSQLLHRRGTAVDVISGEHGQQVLYEAHDAPGSFQTLKADLVFIATGNPVPRLQPPFDATLASHPAVIDNPLNNARLKAVASQARVLLVGSGLTALDILTTLVRQEHLGEILVASRRGLRPKALAPLPAPLAWASTHSIIDKLPLTILLDRIQAPVPDHFVDSDKSVRNWLNILRKKALASEAAGGTWYSAFDDLRDAVWQLWPTLPAAEKRRFMRKLRTWYDIHRFRSPPQNDAVVQAAEQRGQIRFVAARVKSAIPTGNGQIEVALQDAGAAAMRHGTFDTVINCTGLDTMAGIRSNPLLANLLKRGSLRPDTCASGVEVDLSCCAVNHDGLAQPGLRVVGPPTFGTFGDPIGAMYIAAHIHRIMPGIMQTLGR